MVQKVHTWDVIWVPSSCLMWADHQKKLEAVPSIYKDVHDYRKLIAPIVQMSSRHEDANQKSFDFTNFAFLFIIKSANFANIIKIGIQSCLDF